ncbi:MAG: VanZ family protein [Patescibacteria group bacterium]
MKKRLIPLILLIAYIAILIKVMVFKDIPMIRVGQLMLNFGGANAGHEANFIPFKTILPYLFGYKGWLIAGINLIGNIGLLLPIGFLVPLVHRNMTWKKSVILSILSGLIIETLQVVLKVGIFDIDDVILNAIGVLIGYGIFLILAKRIREKKYKTILIAILLAITAASYAFYTFFLDIPPVSSVQTLQGSNPCGETNGTGEIVEIGSGAITIKGANGVGQKMNITDETEIKNSDGPATIEDLNIGDRATIVIYDGKNAAAVLVCNKI